MVMLTRNENFRVHEALKRYAYQSQSYNILRGDKKYFFSPSGIDGAIAYVVHAKVALVAGDPVCDLSDLPLFVREFESFCMSRKWRCCFQAVTDRCHDVLEDLGFGAIKIGEEPIFNLKEIKLDGRQFRGLRKDIRRAKKHGMKITEYRPLSGRNPDWESQMEKLSMEWSKFKGSGEFAFLIGEPDLADPGERKYFLALLENQIEAFVVCNPIYARNGIYFDLMRRKEKTIDGTSQMLIAESFRLLSDQGYDMASLGTAPLAIRHVNDPMQSRIIKLAMDLAFNHLGHFHRYKPLYEFKKQFGPTSWEGRYLAYGGQRFNPIVLYVVLKAYDPSGVKGVLSRQIHHGWDLIREYEKIPYGLLDKLKRMGDRT